MFKIVINILLCYLCKTNVDTRVVSTTEKQSMVAICVLYKYYEYTIQIPKKVNFFILFELSMFAFDNLFYFLYNYSF